MRDIDQAAYYLMALTRIKNLGSRRIIKLLQAFQRPRDIFEASEEELAAVVGSQIAKEIKNFDNWKLVDDEWEFARREELEILTFLDENYPYLLLHTPDFPVVLFKRGNFDFERGNYLSVVGTRKMTPYGKNMIARVIEALKPYRPVIVSGMAYGVDIEAHKQALENQLPTVAVMGTAFTSVYPVAHARYMREIEENGAVLTEFWSYEPTDKNFFVRRNRIVAGMSAGTWIVESAEKGGAMHTARMAFEYNREVFALPGRMDDTYSRGCNRLIRDQVAHILLSPADIPRILHWEEKDVRPSPVQKQLFVELNPDEQKIYDYLSAVDNDHLDVIALETGMNISRAAQLLMMMELNGVVQSLPGKKFKLA